MFMNKKLRNIYHDANKENYVKYRSLVSSVSFDADKLEMITAVSTKWTHVGGNILRLPPARKKFSLVTKLNIGGGAHEIQSVALSPRGCYLALGMSSGELQLRRTPFNLQNDTSMCIRKPVQGGSLTAVTCIRFVPTMENILCCCDLSGRIDILDVEKICKHTVSKENNQINSVDINSSVTKLVSGGKDAILRVYDAVTGKIVMSTPQLSVREFNENPQKYIQSRIYCIKFDPENHNIFFSGGLDGQVRMWDLRKGMTYSRIFGGPYIRGDAVDLWGKILLTGSWRSSKSIDLWDLTSGKHVDTLIPSNRVAVIDAEFYESVKFFRGGKDGSIILAGGSGSGRLDIMNVREKRIDFTVKVGSTIRSVDSTVSDIVCGGLDGICRLVKYNRYDERE